MEQNIINHCKSLGCKSTKNIALAHQLYRELVEVRLMFDIKFHYCSKFDLIFLSAKTTEKSEDVENYIPYCASDKISISFIEELQNEILAKDSKPVTIVLASMESDSTTVFYSFTRGLLDVQKPETLVRPKEQAERRDYLESEIRRRKNYILLEAHQNGIKD